MTDERRHAVASNGKESPVGKLIVVNLMSLDGYACGPDGNLMALPFGESFDSYCVERLAHAGVLLLGRTTFDAFHGFWPAVQDDQSATPDQREISRQDNTIAKVVISDTLGAGFTGPWHDTTRVVPRADAHRAISELKQQVPADILVFGSVTLWHDLFAHGLVDELHLMIGAVILGGGTPALPSSPATLALTETRRADGDNRVLLRYTVAAT